MVAVINIYRLRQDPPDFGMTTEAALLVMYLVGAYLVGGNRAAAVAIGGGVAVLLQFKVELHGLVGRLGDADLRAIMQFVLITCIVLPILPNQTYGPYNAFNPRETWLMVALMVGISLGGYLAYKFLGQNAGLLLGGILGGAISSTATTFSFSRRARENPSGATLAAVAVTIASAMVYVRVLVEVAVAAPSHVAQLAPPVVVMLLASALAAGGVWLFARKSGEQMPPQANPTELRSALIFAALYTAVSFALAAARTHFGGGGLYAIAVVSGLTDMDAITLSTARMVQGGGDRSLSAADGWRVIVIASMSNLVFKAAVAGLVGNKQLLWRVLLLFAVPFVTGIALLLAWPHLAHLLPLPAAR
jgi:uncharacterized membrane protein (DUF4010 family)